jgi:hypothetical protein
MGEIDFIFAPRSGRSNVTVRGAFIFRNALIVVCLPTQNETGVLLYIQNLAFDDLEVTISKVCVRVAFLELAFKSCSVDVIARNISIDQALPDMRGDAPMKMS